MDEDRIQELREAVERLFRGERDGRGWYFDETGIKEPEDPHALSPSTRSKARTRNALAGTGIPHCLLKVIGYSLTFGVGLARSPCDDDDFIGH